MVRVSGTDEYDRGLGDHVRAGGVYARGYAPELERVRGASEDQRGGEKLL